MTTEDVQPQGDDLSTPQGEPQQSVETPQGEIDVHELQAKLDKAVAESRKWETRAKKDAAELAEIKRKAAEMVEPEKVADVETQLRDERNARIESEAALLRYKVAVRKNLPESLADLIKGTTEEEMEACADRVLADLNVLKPKAQAAKEGSNANQSPKATVSSLKEAAEALKVAASG